MALDDDHLRLLLGSVAATHDEEIDCEEFLEVLARCAEALARGEDIPAELRLASEHVKLCGNCREELTALADAIRAG